MKQNQIIGISFTIAIFSGLAYYIYSKQDSDGKVAPEEEIKKEEENKEEEPRRTSLFSLLDNNEEQNKTDVSSIWNQNAIAQSKKLPVNEGPKKLSVQHKIVRGGKRSYKRKQKKSRKHKTKRKSRKHK